jgi:hypothetical protein
MKIRSMSKVDILESQRTKVRAQIPLDDPRRKLTRGVNMDTMEGSRLQFSSFEENHVYWDALDAEELELAKELP